MRFSYLIVALLVAAGAFGWYWKETHPEIVSVTVISVQKGNVEATVANTRAGTVKACRRAKLSPSLGGQISELPFKEGDSVHKGDVLLRVSSSELEAQVKQARDSIVVAKKTAQAGCINANTAKRNADRIRKLYRSKTVSQESYDNAVSTAQQSLIECQLANNNVTVAEDTLRVAEERLKQTILEAPFDGVIAKINGELNEYVTPSPPGILTPPVVDLIEPGCFLVTVPIDEVDAPKVKTGLPARVSLDAWRGRHFETKVSRIGAYIIDREKQARTIDIELGFTKATDLKDLLVGYSADAEIILTMHQDVLRVPTEALLDDSHVLIFNPITTKLEKKAIQQGISNWSYTEILEGVKQGDKVVTSLGKDGVKEGVLAKIEASADAKEDKIK